MQKEIAHFLLMRFILRLSTARCLVLAVFNTESSPATSNKPMTLTRALIGFFVAPSGALSCSHDAMTLRTISPTVQGRHAREALHCRDGV